MKWMKKGLIYAPDERMTWATNSALTPTPLMLNDDVIRVYAGFRDDLGVSRIGYVDLDATAPSKVLNVSQKPVLDIGIPGTFDDNGLILGDVIKLNNRVYMYYIGFQLVAQVKFLAFTGLAISEDGGSTFNRISNAPVMDRSEEGLFFRAIHSVLYENGVWKCWYGVGSDWSVINGGSYPKYNIRYIESGDGINFGPSGEVCVTFEGDEYRIGRPRVSKVDDVYRMHYTIGTLSGTYLPGYAESIDGVSWKRLDSDVGITPSSGGWDSKALSYATPIAYKDKEYLFYNGNDMGKTGFGYAERNLIQGKS